MNTAADDDEALLKALKGAWKKLGISTTTPATPIMVPYHGAEAVQTAVRAVISATPPQTERPMSANIMIKMLIDHGMPEAMAVKLPSQIRKGAPMHDEWKDAFTSRRFVQKLGRSTSAALASASHHLSYKKARTVPAIASATVISRALVRVDFGFMLDMA